MTKLIRIKRSELKNLIKESISYLTENDDFMVDDLLQTNDNIVVSQNNRNFDNEVFEESVNPELLKRFFSSNTIEDKSSDQRIPAIMDREKLLQLAANPIVHRYPKIKKDLESLNDVEVNALLGASSLS